MVRNPLVGVAKLPTGDIIDSLPFEAPWMGPFGSCLIKISDLRLSEDEKGIEAQLADEHGTPYNNGAEWIDIKKFPNEWSK
jgi:hypothetical protein